MLSQLIVWAPTRERAIVRMQRALNDTIITGKWCTSRFVECGAGVFCALNCLPYLSILFRNVLYELEILHVLFWVTEKAPEEFLKHLPISLMSYVPCHLTLLVTSLSQASPPRSTTTNCCWMSRYVEAWKLQSLWGWLMWIDSRYGQHEHFNHSVSCRTWTIRALAKECDA